MTENKRFDMDYEETYGEIMYLDNGDVMTDKEVLDRLNQLNNENGELKKALLFYLDIAISESSSDFQKDLNKECNLLFNCNYEEAKRKYGNFEYAERWEFE